jgi:hypothetical protein
MQEVQMCQENKLVQCAVIRQLLQSSRDIPEQTVCQLITSLESMVAGQQEIFVGQVDDSCVYWIGCGDVCSETKLTFATPDVRNKFASSFEVACRKIGLRIHRSY